MPVTFDQVRDVAWRIAEQHGAEADLTPFHSLPGYVPHLGVTVMFSRGRVSRVINVAFDHTNPIELETMLRQFLAEMIELRRDFAVTIPIPSPPLVRPKKPKKPKPARTAWEWIDQEELE